MGLSRLEKVILVLPVLGVLDVLSTLYVVHLGYPLEKYEVGVLAGLFAGLGLLYLYVPVYLGILLGMTWALIHIKRKLNSSILLDKVVFLLLVGVTCFVYVLLFRTISVNVLLFTSGIASPGIVEMVVYLFGIGYVLMLVLPDVMEWMRRKENSQDINRLE